MAASQWTSPGRVIPHNLPPGSPLYSFRPAWPKEAHAIRLLCTILVLVPLIAALAAAAPQDVVRKTALVTVIAEARGPVANLGPRDFVVREDGATRDVLDVRPATEPLFIALLIDTIRPPSGVLAPTQGSRREIISAATDDRHDLVAARCIDDRRRWSAVLIV